MRIFTHSFVNNNKGITLVESVVSAAIVGLGLACALWSFLFGRLFINTATHHTQAIKIAQARLENMKFNGYDIIIADGSLYDIPVTIDDGGTQNEDFDFDGILDPGEDINGNGGLDTRTGDDLIGDMDVVLGMPYDLFGLASDMDDVVNVTIFVSWQEKGFMTRQVTVSVQSFITKRGAVW
jgi:type II secretory pathway pseudopilin PulG